MTAEAGLFGAAFGLAIFLYILFNWLRNRPQMTNDQGNLENLENFFR